MKHLQSRTWNRKGPFKDLPPTLTDNYNPRQNYSKIPRLVFFLNTCTPQRLWPVQTKKPKLLKYSSSEKKKPTENNPAHFLSYSKTPWYSPTVLLFPIQEEYRVKPAVVHAHRQCTQKHPMVHNATGSINSLVPQVRLNLMRSAHTVIQEDISSNLYME